MALDGIRCAYCATALDAVRQPHVCRCVRCGRETMHALCEHAPPECSPRCVAVIVPADLDAGLHSIVG